MLRYRQIFFCTLNMMYGLVVKLHTCVFMYDCLCMTIINYTIFLHKIYKWNLHKSKTPVTLMLHFKNKDTRDAHIICRQPFKTQEILQYL